MSFLFEYRSSDVPFVDMIWHTYSEESGTFLSQAQTNWEMVLMRDKGKTTFFVRGPETKASMAETSADTEFFGIVFKLGTFMPHLPIKTVMDRSEIALPEATNQSFWLNSTTWQFPTFENSDTFLNHLVREGVLAHDPVVNAVLGGQEPHLSPRAVQYRILRATGLTQSTIRQIERAKQAVDLLQAGVASLDVVYQLGYFDQAHLTRSLKRFMGQTPSQIAAMAQP